MFKSSKRAAVAGLIGLAGSLLQVGYGIAALIYPYPAITDPGFEAMWLLVNLGMVASIFGWLAIEPSTSRRALHAGAVVAALGHLLRACVSAWLIVAPDADVDLVDPFVVSSIALMFGGMTLLGVATLRYRRLDLIESWAPLVTVVAGVATASLYATDKELHFALLGLLWGPPWMAVPIIVLRHRNRPRRRRSRLPSSPHQPEQVDATAAGSPRLPLQQKQP